MDIKKIIVALFCIGILLLSVPMKAGRTGNGSSDFLRGTLATGAGGGMFPNNPTTQAQGTVSFYMNILSFPPTTGATFPGCAASCATILNLIGSNVTGVGANASCTTTIGACLEIFLCNTLSFCGTSTLYVNIVTPSVGVSQPHWNLGSVSAGPHVYTILLNRTAANSALYIDGVLQTIAFASQSGDPGPINYVASGCTSGCFVTVLASSTLPYGSGTGSYANVTISDISFWDIPLNAGEINSLAHCVPPNRVEPEHVRYYPVYGVDSPDPDYSSVLFGSVPQHTNQIPLTVSGTTRAIQQVGCQPGGAYH